MTVALFRLIEAAKGSIVIDDLDTSQLGLYDLRKHITIIPQVNLPDILDTKHDAKIM